MKIINKARIRLLIGWAGLSNHSAVDSTKRVSDQAIPPEARGRETAFFYAHASD
jgi:hypothetical protein